MRQVTPLPSHLHNQILLQTAEDMQPLPDGCVHLTVTSPPYNVGKEYDRDLTLEEYRAFLRRVWQEVYRVLVPGGMFCLNVANLGRKPYIPLRSLLTLDLLDMGFLPVWEIVWDKGASAGKSTAWGTWRSPVNPVLRDVHEYILVFAKPPRPRFPPDSPPPGVPPQVYEEYTKSLWSFPAVSARQIGHPAPFPVELPRRCILLFTREGEVVLDPFMGSGQTALAALETGRVFVGFEIDPRYRDLARQRITAWQRGREEGSTSSLCPALRRTAPADARTTEMASGP